MRVIRILTALCLISAASLAADVAGRWKLVANAPDGNTYHVTLVLNKEDGKLAGVLDSDRGQMPLANIVYAEGELRFDLMLDMGPIPFRLKVDGDKLTGTLTAPDGSAGTVTGQREAPPAAAAVAGKWEITATDPDGTARRATLDLKQEGEQLKGAITLDSGDTLPISTGKVNGDTFELKVPIGDGDIAVSGKVAGDAVAGEYKIPTGEAGKFTGKRAAASLAGRWSVVARDAEGNEIRSTLDLKVEGDRLTGTLTTESGDSAPLVEGKVQGDSFSFKIYVGDGNIEVKGKLENGKVAGDYVTPNGSKGTYTGTRS
ncbi:MAG: hypothetical protein ACUVS7_09250 [Bryobacteraceae bacterium]